MPEQDWFAENAPKAPSTADATGGDWFAANAPSAGMKMGSIPKPNAQDVADRLTKQYVPAMQMAMGGGGIKTVGEGAVGLAKAVLPSAERAGQAFKEVSAAAGQHTVPITNSLSDALMNYQKLVDAGGSRSMAVSKLLNRVTNPAAAPLTYDEARLFYSNISRLSADEAQRLTPVMKRAVGQIANEFGGAISDTAEQAGKLDQFHGAMKEYAKAMKYKDIAQGLKDVAKNEVVKGVIKGLGAGGGAYAAYKVFDDH